MITRHPRADPSKRALSTGVSEKASVEPANGDLGPAGMSEQVDRLHRFHGSHTDRGAPRYHDVDTGPDRAVGYALADSRARPCQHAESECHCRIA